MPTARRGTAEHDHERNARHCRNMCAARIDTDEEIQLSIERRKLHEVRLAAEVFDRNTNGGNHVLGVGIVPRCPRHVECRVIAEVEGSNDLCKILFRPCLQTKCPLDTEPDLSFPCRRRKERRCLCPLRLRRRRQNGVLVPCSSRKAAYDLLIGLRLQRFIEIMRNRDGMCIEPRHAAWLTVKDP